MNKYNAKPRGVTHHAVLDFFFVHTKTLTSLCFTKNGMGNTIYTYVLF
ncbi:MAG: hypothetical protein UV60_C0019G0010 [Parcubacteria group bacterium GW2011_GWA2_43_11]|nr:MAG: hypothetical protein UV60_C0019G0010 [Parcubacteria group bacterium GW2011_GWA2_43_11]